MATFSIGPGIARAMSDDATAPATDEIHVHGGLQQAQWSIAFGDNGREYRWVRATNRVYRYSPSGAATGLVAKLARVVDAGLAKGHREYGGPLVGGTQTDRWGPNYDCSSFVSSMYREALGISLTGFTDAIAQETDRIAERDAVPGDIILYEYQSDGQPGVRYPHTGLWLGNGEMLDCQWPRGLGRHSLLARPFVIHRARAL